MTLVGSPCINLDMGKASLYQDYVPEPCWAKLFIKKYSLIWRSRPWHWTVATTGPGGQWIRKSTGPPKKPTGPPKTCNDPNVLWFHAWSCTLLYIRPITKNKYKLTLPSEFCRFPVKIMAAYEALKKPNKKKQKQNWPIGPVENKLWWPELARQPQKGMRASRHIANVKACAVSSP